MPAQRYLVNLPIAHFIICLLYTSTGAFADYASRHRLPVITPELLQACIEKTGVPIQTKFVTDFVMHRYRQSPVYAQIQKQKNRRKEMDAR